MQPQINPSELIEDFAIAAKAEKHAFSCMG